MYSLSEYGSGSLLSSPKSVASDDFNMERGERTPLLGSVNGLNNRRCYDDAEVGIPAEEYKELTDERISLALLIPALLLMAGIGVGVFLLYKMTTFPSVDFTFEMVEREQWENKTALNVTLPSNQKAPLDASNVVDVFVTHTRGQSCSSIKECSAQINQLQLKYFSSQHSDLPYNFLVGGDGRSYEIRGWSEQNLLKGAQPATKSLAIGLIGDFTTSAPDTNQLDALQVLLIESVHRRKLQRSYSIYGMRNLTASSNDGEALYDKIKDWHNFASLVSFL